MPITLGGNIASLRGQRELAKTSQELGTVFQRLSSGQRINKAADDAAGLAIADSLNASSRIANQAVRNLNDGQSLLSIADSAIEHLSDIVVRLEELAAQAANGVYANKQRKAMDDEAQALSKEFFRISKTTEFNGQKLLSGEFDAINLQGGVGENAVLSADVGGAIGNGTFGGVNSYVTQVGPTFTQSQDVVLGDLNGDGFLDLVSTGTIGFGGVPDGYTDVRLGTGNGTFGVSISYHMDRVSYAVSLGDLNGDGNLDLVTAGSDVAADGRVSVRLGTGSGTFGAATSYIMETGYSFGLTVGDVNGDERLDVITAGYGYGLGGAIVRFGTGDGTLSAATSYLSGAHTTYDVAIGDLNGDGLPDLAIAGVTGPDGRATIRLGTGGGNFGAETVFLMDGGYSYAIELGDLNGDGILDLVTAGVDDASAGTATVRLGQGNGTFGSATSYTAETGGTRDLSLGDLNGDGFLDLVTSGIGSGGRATVRLGTGSGTFGASTSFLMDASNSLGVALGDVNGDGVLDLVTAGLNDGLSGSAAIRLAETSSGVSPLLPFSLKSLADARQALPVFRRKREQLAAQRGEIGAFQSRIDVARNVLEVSSENFKAAESHIRDADIAEESSRLVRLNILQQAAASVLAQANQQPALALQLLGG